MCYKHHHGMHGGCESASKGMGYYGGHWAQPFGNVGFRPPVNVEELEDRYEIRLALPGRSSTDFQIKVQGDLLTISGGRPHSEDETNTRWARREYRLGSFERQFQLNDKIDADGITANYTNGILLATLPKFPHTHTPSKDIFVS